MRRMYLVATVALTGLVGLAAGCASGDPTVIPGGSGGAASGGSSGGSGGSGGAVGTGGTVGSGGAVGSGGITVPDAGGGMDVPAASGGTSGSGGSAPSGAVCTGDCRAVLKMDGAFNLDPPANQNGPDGLQGPSAIDGVPGPVCVVTENNATHGSPFKELHWQLTGPGVTMGTPYKVTFSVTGVLECKTYLNLAKCPRPANQGRAAIYDMWCPEGQDPPLTQMGDHYNTVMLSVTPVSSTSTPNIGPMKGPLPTVGNWWQLNECPVGVTEGHLTWQVQYEKSITVPGGSWINFVEFDTNCREIVNCGSSPNASMNCPEHFSILPPAGSIPAPPASIMQQPAAAGGGAYGQWIYFDVKSITPM